jgi:tRNA U38,U39,U40 pseudouridine synthase TruA
MDRFPSSVYYKSDIVCFRTDQGVHALKTAAHCDLDFPQDKQPHQIIHTVNSYLTKKDFDIRYVSIFITKLEIKVQLICLAEVVGLNIMTNKRQNDCLHTDLIFV